MKKYLVAIIILLLCSFGRATDYVNQGFEGTGYDNGETWVYDAGVGGIIDPDYTTNPIEGSQSLRMVDDTSNGSYTLTNFTTTPGLNEVYVFFKFKVVDAPDSGDREILTTYYYSDPTVEPHEVISLGHDGTFNISDPQLNFYIQGTTQYSLDTVYYVWCFIDHSVAGKSSGWLKVGTDGNIPAGNELSWSNENFTETHSGMNLIGFTMYHGLNYEYIVDHVVVSDTPIGSLEEGSGEGNSQQLMLSGVGK